MAQELVLAAAIVTASAYLVWFIPYLRGILTINYMVIFAAASSELWVNAYFEAVGCRGTILKGLTCPEWNWLTHFAVGHQTLWFYVLVYALLVFPVLQCGAVALHLFTVLFINTGAEAPSSAQR